jgi:hypothetical protein
MAWKNIKWGRAGSLLLGMGGDHHATQSDAIQAQVDREYRADAALRDRLQAETGALSDAARQPSESFYGAY